MFIENGQLEKWPTAFSSFHNEHVNKRQWPNYLFRGILFDTFQDVANALDVAPPEDIRIALMLAAGIGRLEDVALIAKVATKEDQAHALALALRCEEECADWPNPWPPGRLDKLRTLLPPLAHPDKDPQARFGLTESLR